MQLKQIRISCYAKCRSYISNEKSETQLHTPKKLTFIRLFECYKDISSINTKLSVLGTRFNFCII